MALPNRDRALRLDFEALDYPPHHLSHWGKLQLKKLAVVSNVELSKIEQEVLTMHECRAVLRKWLMPTWPESYFARGAGFLLFNKFTYCAWHRMGLLNWNKLGRGSLIALYVKQPA